MFNKDEKLAKLIKEFEEAVQTYEQEVRKVIDSTYNENSLIHLVYSSEGLFRYKFILERLKKTYEMGGCVKDAENEVLSDCNGLNQKYEELIRETLYIWKNELN